MLLINDDKAKLLKINIFLNEGVCAQNNIGLAGFNQIQRFMARGAGHAAGEQNNMKTDGSSPGAQCCVVLFGQDFRRRHERDLITIFADCYHGRHGHQGFPASHIALQKTVHSGSRLKIALNFTNHSGLSAGQGKRQRRIKLLQQISINGKRNAFIQNTAGFLDGHPQLKKEKLVIDQTPVCLGTGINKSPHRRVAFGKMNVHQRLADIDQISFTADFRGNRRCDIARIIFQGGMHDFTDVLLM